MSKKKKEDIIVTSLGGSTESVTGSCFRIEYPLKDGTRRAVLLEVGMIQENGTKLHEYQVNQRMLDRINIDDVDYIFLMHSHMDHAGNIPSLIAKGYRGKIITTYKTKEIVAKLLTDGAFIHMKNVDALAKKDKKLPYLFTQQDVCLVDNQMVSYEYEQMYELNENISFRFQHNSHVVGASQLELFIKKPSGHIKKIVYTSDLGSRLNREFQPFLEEQAIIPKCNCMISESTYGESSRTFTRETARKERKQMIGMIKEYMQRGNRVLIPAFSFGRSQYLMSWLYDEFHDKDIDFPILIDSNLTNQINGVYSKILQGEDREYWMKVLSWDKFVFIKQYKDTETWANKKNQKMVCISSSGMLDNGHVKTYAKSILENRNDIIIFTGYVSEGTLGRKIQNDNQKTVTIDGVTYVKRCKVKIFSSFSSHIQQEELINYFKCCNCDLIVLHHGNDKAKNELKEKATEELFKIGKTTPIDIASKDNNRWIL